MANHGFSLRSLWIAKVFLAVKPPTFGFILMRDASLYPENSKSDIC